jgi:hypothetical protein
MAELAMIASATTSAPAASRETRMSSIGWDPDRWGKMPPD